MSNTPSDEELTACYREANGEMHGKAQPLTTQRIFRAMRAAIVKFGTQQPVVLEPLTDGQAKEVLWNEHLRWMNAAGLDTEGMRPTGEWLDNWLFYVRAIERAHGITQKGGSNADTATN